jgi:major intracellular serine protease
MYTLQVTSEKLNVRNTPQPDVNFINWVSDLPKGTIFNCDRLVKGGMLDNIDDWYEDTSDNFYWAGGVRQLTGITADPATADNYPWWIKLNDLESIWKKTRGEGVKIGILDTGIDTTHFALTSQIKKTVYSAYRQGADPADSKGSVEDSNGHGTKCAGMIAAFDASTPAHCCGIAPSAELYIYKVFNDKVGDFNEFLVTGIMDAIRDGVDIISISRSYNPDPLVDAQIRRAVANNIFVVVSGGNTSEGKNPLLAESGIIRVGAINDSGNDTLNDASINAEAAVSLSCYAPGINIITTSNDGGFTTDSGTSFATPLIAGLFALKLSLKEKSDRHFDKIMQEFTAAITPNSSQFKVLNIKTFIS